jgi:hypothetical protein
VLVDHFSLLEKNKWFIEEYEEEFESKTELSK